MKKKQSNKKFADLITGQKKRTIRQWKRAGFLAADNLVKNFGKN